MHMKVFYENRGQSITRFYCPGLTSVIHLHKEIELIYVVRGRAVAYADKNSCALNPGEIFLVFPNQIHYYQTLEEGEYHVYVFSPKIMHGYADLLSKSVSDMNYFSCCNQPEIQHMFEKMKAASGKYDMLTISGYLNVIMSFLLPKIKLNIVTADGNTTLYRIVNYCTHHYNTDIALSDVAENLHLNRYYVSHIVNQNLKVSFNDYINNLRIAEACNLLRETNEKIADISEDVGFGTIRSFNRAFKKIVGVSPITYRKNNISLKISNGDS